MTHCETNDARQHVDSPAAVRGHVVGYQRTRNLDLSWHGSRGAAAACSTGWVELIYANADCPTILHTSAFAAKYCMYTQRMPFYTAQLQRDLACAQRDAMDLIAYDHVLEEPPLMYSLSEGQSRSSCRCQSGCCPQS